MDLEAAKQLATRLLAADLTLEEFLAALGGHVPEPPLVLDDATLDLDRQRRCGFPEVVFAEGKECDTLIEIVCALQKRSVDVLVTRMSDEQAEAVLDAVPAGGKWNRRARTFRLASGEAPPPLIGKVIVATAGTADLPVAEEALETLGWMGVRAQLITDIGVAGPQRLLSRLPELAGADAVVVAAGMEGALPSVVGGYVDCPVIGLPTSVGYGAHGGGLAPLLSMLNSCAANVTVVNVDAGFKAGYVAGLIAHRRSERGPSDASD